jgi:hypothetical protein
MKKFLSSHIASGDDPKVQLLIEAVDKPGPGGAYHRYDITCFDTTNNPSSEDRDGYKSSYSRLPVVFQNGPIKEVGVNGVTNEALLAIVIDRLQSFQAGPYACIANAIALKYCVEALETLKMRTIGRMARGVEGTSDK